MRRAEPWVVAGITVGAALIRFLALDHQSFDHDEAVTAVRVLHPSLGDTLSVVGHLERSPPLYYLLSWAWSKPFGTGEVGLRSLSALAGTLTVPVAYLLARQLASRWAGAVAATLVALNPYLVWYSQEARSYALFVLFASVALLFFARALREPSTRNLGWWATASALALLSHYFAVFTIVPEGLWLIVADPRRRRALAAVAVTAAVGLALVPLAIAQEGNDRQNMFADISLSTRAGETAIHFVASEEPGWMAGSDSIDRLQLLAALGGAALAAAAGGLLLARATDTERRGALVVAAVGLAAIALPFALALVGLDFVDPRNMIGSLVPVLVAGGIAFGLQRARAPGAVCAVGAAALSAAVLVAVYASAQMERPDWRGAAVAIGPPTGPRILVVPKNGDDGLVYYLHAREFERKRFRRGIGVREIDVLSKQPLITPPGRGFELVEQRGLAPSFVLRRFRSPRTVLVRPADVSGNRVLMERSKVLIDGAPLGPSRRDPAAQPKSAGR